MTGNFPHAATASTVGQSRFKRPTVPADILRTWRQEHGWPQTEAAVRLGVSYRAYKSYEEGACPQVVWMAAQFYSLTHRKRRSRNG